VQLDGGTRRQLVRDGIAWFDLTERERVIMLVMNGGVLSNVDSLDAAWGVQH